MNDNPTETEAIRQVLREGGFPDYVDVALAVKKKFGLTVGSGKVEEVALAMRHEADKVGGSHASARDYDMNRVREFVDRMGGFEQARAAIDRLEGT